MESKDYPDKLEVRVRLNAFGTPCFVEWVRNAKTYRSCKSCKDRFSPAELSVLASGAKEIILRTGDIAYRRVAKSTAMTTGLYNASIIYSYKK